MRLLGYALAVMLALARAAAAGDGTWTQVDAWARGFQWVTNVEREAWVLGTAAGRDDGEWWSRASVLRTWQVGPDKAPWKLRAGVAARAEQIPAWEIEDHDLAHCLPSDPDMCGALEFGARLSVDRWAEYGRWGTFVMADWISIDNAKLGVLGLTHLPSGIGGQLSVWHEDGGEVTPTIMLSKSLTRRLSVRVGHKFVEDETFIGISFSTY